MSSSQAFVNVVRIAWIVIRVFAALWCGQQGAYFVYQGF